MIRSPKVIRFRFSSSDDEYKTLEKMTEMGGSFVKQLARLYQYGDGLNKTKLLNAFPQYFDSYFKETQK